MNGGGGGGGKRDDGGGRWEEGRNILMCEAHFVFDVIILRDVISVVPELVPCVEFFSPTRQLPPYWLTGMGGRGGGGREKGEKWPFGRA